jgi:hypothetical protein
VHAYQRVLRQGLLSPYELFEITREQLGALVRHYEPRLPREALRPPVNFESCQALLPLCTADEAASPALQAAVARVARLSERERFVRALVALSCSFSMPLQPSERALICRCRELLRLLAWLLPLSEVFRGVRLVLEVTVPDHRLALLCASIEWVLSVLRGDGLFPADRPAEVRASMRAAATASNSTSPKLAECAAEALSVAALCDDTNSMGEALRLGFFLISRLPGCNPDAAAQRIVSFPDDAARVMADTRYASILACFPCAHTVHTLSTRAMRPGMPNRDLALALRDHCVAQCFTSLTSWPSWPASLEAAIRALPDWRAVFDRAEVKEPFSLEHDITQQLLSPPPEMLAVEMPHERVAEFWRRFPRGTPLRAGEAHDPPFFSSSRPFLAPSFIRCVRSKRRIVCRGRLLC